MIEYKNKNGLKKNMLGRKLQKSLPTFGWFLLKISFHYHNKMMFYLLVVNGQAYTISYKLGVKIIAP